MHISIARALAFAFALALTATATGATVASPVLKVASINPTFTFKNSTDKYVWADISWSYTSQAWHIDRAFCLAPGQTESDQITYNHESLGPQVRFRAEIKSGDCRSGTQTTITNHENLRDSRRLEANVARISDPRNYYIFLNYANA
jgi:hypothetical protein